MTAGRGRRHRPLLPGRPDREVAGELAYHFESRVADFMAQGMTEAEARAAAEARMGDLSGVQEECTSLLESERRESRRRDVLSDLAQDIQFGARSAARTPLFTALAIFILAIGIGANTAVFSVVKSVLVDPLPFARAGELVYVYSRLEDGTQERGALSAANLRDVQERQRSFSATAAISRQISDAAYTTDGGALALKATLMDPELLGVLGVEPAIGRGFVAEDVGADPVVLVSHGTWQQLLGGRTDVIGHTVVLNGIAREIVGVLPRGFIGPAGPVDFFIPLNLAPTLASPNAARRSHWLLLIGRLSPGTTLEQARA